MTATYQERMRALVNEALQADAEIERTGEVYRAEEVHAWMDRLARGDPPDRRSLQAAARLRRHPPD